MADGGLHPVAEGRSSDITDDGVVEKPSDTRRHSVLLSTDKLFFKVFLPFELGGGFVTVAVGLQATVDELKQQVFQKAALRLLDHEHTHDADGYLLKVCKSGVLLFVGEASVSAYAQAGDRVAMSLVAAASEERRLRVLRDGVRTAVYSWGDNDSGQLAVSLPSPRTLIPTEISELRGIGVISVAAGCYTAAAITAGGELYMWGQGVEQHTHGPPKKEPGEERPRPTHGPWRLAALNKVVTSVACGAFHTLATTDNGSLYAWGNGECGQLGLGRMVKKQIGPWRLHTLRNDVVVSIACGNLHSLAVTDSGGVFAWGTNEVGQLGLETSQAQVFVPERVHLPSGSDVHAPEATFVNCGFEHSACITRKGLLFVWGGNAYGQLGLGDRTDRHAPAQLVGLPRVRSVSCGVNHSAVVTVDGEFRAFGNGASCKLGTGNDADSDHPVVPALATLTKDMGMFRVVKAQTGNSYSTALAVGQDDQGDHRDFVIVMGSVALPPSAQGETMVAPTVTDLGGRRIVDIAAGFSHHLAAVEL
mmetsp:Transcript_652/g.1210  ORF Transcript_652/g.1210 Transcript_652/m.1210 type:complete len:532 (-) Transcript_652:74-1669(-)